MRISNFTKYLLAASATGSITGLVILGLGGRLAMRGVALMGGNQGSFSWGGTMEVLLLGSLIGLLAGLLYGIVQPFWSARPVVAGLSFGLLTYLAILILPIEGKGAAMGFPKLQATIHFIFGSLFILHGLALAALYPRMVHYLKRIST